MNCTSLSSYLFPILLLAMAVYVLVGAISGSGRLFQMDNIIDEKKPQFRKYTRALYFALAGIMIVLALIGFLQSALYNQLYSYRVTERYKTEFASVIDEKGEVSYTVSGNTYGPYSVNEEYNESLPIQVFLAKAKEAYPDLDWTQSQSSLSCVGSTASATQNPIELLYYDETTMFGPDGKPEYPRRENGVFLRDAENNLVYNDVALHNVYVSSFSRTRSDANDGSFASKLYGTFSMKLLSILNYILLGLAAVGLIGLFLVTRKYTDKEKLQKAREQQVHGPSMPSSAFEFDEDEKKPVQNKK